MFGAFESPRLQSSIPRLTNTAEEVEPEEVEIDFVLIAFSQQTPTDEKLFDLVVRDCRSLHRERSDDGPNLEEVRVVDDLPQLHQDVGDLLVDSGLKIVTSLSTGHELVVEEALTFR